MLPQNIIHNNRTSVLVCVSICMLLVTGALWHRTYKNSNFLLLDGNEEEMDNLLKAQSNTDSVPDTIKSLWKSHDSTIKTAQNWLGESTADKEQHEKVIEDQETKQDEADDDDLNINNIIVKNSKNNETEYVSGAAKAAEATTTLFVLGEKLNELSQSIQIAENETISSLNLLQQDRSLMLAKQKIEDDAKKALTAAESQVSDAQSLYKSLLVQSKNDVEHEQAAMNRSTLLAEKVIHLDGQVKEAETNESSLATKRDQAKAQVDQLMTVMREIESSMDKTQAGLDGEVIAVGMDQQELNGFDPELEQKEREYDKAKNASNDAMIFEAKVDGDLDRLVNVSQKMAGKIMGLQQIQLDETRNTSSWNQQSELSQQDWKNAEEQADDAVSYAHDARIQWKQANEDKVSAEQSVLNAQKAYNHTKDLLNEALFQQMAARSQLLSARNNLTVLNEEKLEITHDMQNDAISQENLDQQLSQAAATESKDETEDQALDREKTDETEGVQAAKSRFDAAADEYNKQLKEFTTRSMDLNLAKKNEETSREAMDKAAMEAKAAEEHEKTVTQKLQNAQTLENNALLKLENLTMVLVGLRTNYLNLKSGESGFVDENTKIEQQHISDIQSQITTEEEHLASVMIDADNAREVYHTAKGEMMVANASYTEALNRLAAAKDAESKSHLSFTEAETDDAKEAANELYEAAEVVVQRRSEQLETYETTYKEAYSRYAAAEKAWIIANNTVLTTHQELSSLSSALNVAKSNLTAEASKSKGDYLVALDEARIGMVLGATKAQDAEINVSSEKAAVAQDNIDVSQALSDLSQAAAALETSQQKYKEDEMKANATEAGLEPQLLSTAETQMNATRDTWMNLEQKLTETTREYITAQTVTQVAKMNANYLVALMQNMTTKTQEFDNRLQELESMYLKSMDEITQANVTQQQLNLDYQSNRETMEKAKKSWDEAKTQLEAAKEGEINAQQNVTMMALIASQAAQREANAEGQYVRIHQVTMEAAAQANTATAAYQAMIQKKEAVSKKINDLKEELKDANEAVKLSSIALETSHQLYLNATTQLQSLRDALSETKTQMTLTKSDINSLQQRENQIQHQREAAKETLRNAINAQETAANIVANLLQRKQSVQNEAQNQATEAAMAQQQLSVIDQSVAAAQKDLQQKMIEESQVQTKEELAAKEANIALIEENRAEGEYSESANALKQLQTQYQNLRDQIDQWQKKEAVAKKIQSAESVKSKSGTVTTPN